MELPGKETQKQQRQILLVWHFYGLGEFSFWENGHEHDLHTLVNIEQVSQACPRNIQAALLLNHGFSSV